MAIAVLTSVTGAQTAVIPVQNGDLGRGGHMTVSFISDNVADVMDLEFSQDGGSTWNDVYLSGSQVQLTDTNRLIPLDTICLYRLAGTFAGTGTVALHRLEEV